MSAAGGVGLACAASLVFGGHSHATALDALDQRVGAVVVRAPRPVAGPQVKILANAPPLFPVLSGVGAAPEVAVRLEGVARTPQRVAALLAINGAPAAWLALGETRDGVTLEDVSGSGVTVGTMRGPKALVLGSGGAQPVADAAPPPGMRTPPEPASAPQVVKP